MGVQGIEVRVQVGPMNGKLVAMLRHEAVECIGSDPVAIAEPQQQGQWCFADETLQMAAKSLRDLSAVKRIDKRLG